MALGLDRAGFVCVGAVEKDARASLTFEKNFSSRMGGPKLLALGPSDGDVERIDFKNWSRRLRDAGVHRLDVLEGGPPCQSFSMVGRGKLNALRDGGFLQDPRNHLWRHFFDAVEAFRPRLFIVENVPGMLNHGGVNVAESICLAGRRAGYHVRCAVLNAAAFGVPQTRERLFILGVSSELHAEPSFPSGHCQVTPIAANHGFRVPREGFFRDRSLFAGTLLPESPTSRCVWVQEAIDDLPPFRAHLEPNYRAKVPWQPARYRPGRPSAYAASMRSWPGFECQELTDHVCKATPRDHETFAGMSPGDKYPDAVQIAEKRYQYARHQAAQGKRSWPRKQDFVPPYKLDVFEDKWHKLIPTAPSWTVTAHLAKDTYSHIHYDRAQKRMITIREAARLQSFPDGFEFVGNIGDRFRQIGNAVPPLLAEGVGLHIRKILAEADKNAAPDAWPASAEVERQIAL